MNNDLKLQPCGDCDPCLAGRPDQCALFPGTTRKVVERMKSDWQKVSEDNLPGLDEIVWLWDGKIMWVGGRADDGDGWLWANTYFNVWHNGTRWDGDLEVDDDYKPTHWKRLPDSPKGGDAT